MICHWPKGSGSFLFLIIVGHLMSICARAETNLLAPVPVVSIVVTDAEAAEGSNTTQLNSASFTVRRTGATNGALTVYIAVEGTASNGVDYASVPSSVTIPAGANSIAILIQPRSDNLVEGTETVSLRMATLFLPAIYPPIPPPYEIDPGNGVAQATIVDAAVPAPPWISIVATDAEAAEGGITAAGSSAQLNTGSVVVRRTGSLANALTVSVAVEGTASNGVDYVTLPSVITLPANAASVVVVVQPKVDSLVEDTETVVLRLVSSTNVLWLYAPVGGTTYMVDPTNAVAQVNILDGEVSAPPPVITIVATDAEAAESVAGNATNTARFTISRSGPTNDSLSVTVALGGTANNGVDYAPVASTVVIPAGASSREVVIQPHNDTLVEGTETVVMRLTNTVNSAYVMGAGNGWAQATILDDDVAIPPPPPTPTVSIVATDAEAAEGGMTTQGTVNAGNTASFAIRRTGPTNNALTVIIGTEGTAINGEDYVKLPIMMTIPAGASVASLVVHALNDNLVEGTETVVVRVVSPATNSMAPYLPVGTWYVVDPANAVAQAEILDAVISPPVPVVSIAVTDAEASESASSGAANSGAFTISRTGSTEGELTVKVAIGGTASNGVDYAALDTTVVIPAGSTSRLILIEPRNDTLVEGTESVWLRLTNTSASGYTIRPTDNLAQVLILDDDLSLPNPPPGGSNSFPAVTVVALRRYATEQFTNTGVFRFVRTGNLGQALTVVFGIGGSASNGVDYVQLPNTVSFPAGAASVDLVVRAYDDNLAEGPESVVVTLNTLAAPVSASLRTMATVMILDRINYQLPGGVAQSTSTVVRGLALEQPGQIAVAGVDGEMEVIEVSSNLADWEFLAYGFVSSGRLQIADPDAEGTPARFYRHVVINPPE
jgi:hypothetical protein